MNDTNDPNLLATAHIDIAAPISTVWRALTDPALIAQYMFGTTVRTTWQEGAPITWAGEWEGTPYQDKGTITAIDPPHRLQYTHFSPLSGQPDLPAHYHTVTIALTDQPPKTVVTLTQDGNGSADERLQAEQTWALMLTGLKQVAEEQT